jgi:hypothetical protein
MFSATHEREFAGPVLFTRERGILCFQRRLGHHGRAMHRNHPKSPETEEWLAELRQRDPRRHLGALLAMRFTFDFLASDPACSERNHAAREELDLSPAELEDVYADVAHLLNVARDELDAIEAVPPKPKLRMGAGREKTRTKTALL